MSGELRQPRYMPWNWIVPPHAPDDELGFPRVGESAGRSTFRALTSYPRVVALTLLAQTSAVMGALVPKIIGAASEDMFTPGHEWLVVAVGVGLALLFSAQWFGEVVAENFITLSIRRLQHALRADLVRKLTVAGEHDRTPGEILNTLEQDTEAASMVKFAYSFPLMMIVFLISATAVTLPISWKLSLLILVAGVATAVASKWTSGPIKKVSGKRRAAESAASALATDYAQGVRVIKGLGALEHSSARFAAANDRARTALLADAQVTFRMGLARQLVPGGFTALVLAVAATMASRGTISSGDLVTVAMITPSVLNAMGISLGLMTENWARGSASMQRITQLRQTLSDAAVHHTDGDGVDADSAARIHAVAQRLAETPGLVVLQPASAEEFAAARAIVTEVSRHPDALETPHAVSIFEGSLADNINPDNLASPAAVRAALDAAQCEDIITRMGGWGPAGELPQALIGEAGMNLSGGQRQRLALARVVARNPRIAVFDEPTTGLDTVTLSNLVAAVARLRAEATTVVISTSGIWWAAATTRLRGKDLHL